MIVHPAAQGSEEWINARLGIPTASQFHRIMTPKQMKPSSGADRYIAELLLERVWNVSFDGHFNERMERGNILDERAARWYELRTGWETRPVGLCLLDDGSAGCSPDRLVGEDGGLEIKCPKPETHMMYLLGMDSVTAEYRAQCQGAMWITGRKWWDTLSYHDDLPKALVRVERDEDFIAALATCVQVFNERLAAYAEWLRDAFFEPGETVPTGFDVQLPPAATV